MNKGEFIRSVGEKAGMTNKEAAVAVDSVIEVVTEALKAGDKIQLVGFGSFEVKNVAEKMGINPTTKAKIKIPASKKPVFKFGKAYKELFN